MGATRREGVDTTKDKESDQKVTGKGPVTETIHDEEIMGGNSPNQGDRAMQEFSAGSLRAVTNQIGMEGRTFSVDPTVRSKVSDFDYPEVLRTTKHPVQDFFVYDGAQATIGATGKTPTNRDQLLPDYRIREQDAVEWNRVGSKKGWMFNGPPQQNKPGYSGENKPTHTSDGWVKKIKERRWGPVPRSADKQGLAQRQLPAIDIENNARGIGVTGEGSGNGGMAGGYHQINRSRLRYLPYPKAKFNWTGTRLRGTAREDQGGSANASGAGGYRAGYQSLYPVRPSFPSRRTVGIARVTQTAA